LIKGEFSMRCSSGKSEPSKRRGKAAMRLRSLAMGGEEGAPRRREKLHGMPGRRENQMREKEEKISLFIQKRGRRREKEGGEKISPPKNLSKKRKEGGPRTR